MYRENRVRTAQHNIGRIEQIIARQHRLRTKRIAVSDTVGARATRSTGNLTGDTVAVDNISGWGAEHIADIDRASNSRRSSRIAANYPGEAGAIMYCAVN